MINKDNFVINTIADKVIKEAFNDEDYQKVIYREIGLKNTSAISDTALVVAKEAIKDYIIQQGYPASVEYHLDDIFKGVKKRLTSLLNYYAKELKSM
jgi:hypothetical protein